MELFKKYQLRQLFIIILTIFILAQCGGANKEDGFLDPNLSESEALDLAMTALIEGDLETAQQTYEAIIEKFSSAQASFGAALVKIMLLSTSDPTTHILQSVNQEPINILNLIGPQSYLAALYGMNEAEDVLIDNYTEPFYGRFSTDEPYSYSYQSNSCARIRLQGSFKSAEGNLNIYLYYWLSLVATDQQNQTTTFNLEAGSTYLLEEDQDYPCGISSLLDDMYVDAPEEGFFWIDETLSTGTVTINQIGTEEGAIISLTFNDVVLYNGDEQSFTLNGTLADIISNQTPNNGDYFPFFTEEGEGLELSEILGQVAQGLTTTGLQEYLSEYIPLFEEIGDLLREADQNDDFEFIIPADLYYGYKDIHLNRIDLKAMRAGFKFLLTSFYFVNSWEVPMMVSGIYDSEGNLLKTKEEIVTDLNDFFTLKSEHQFNEAQIAFSEGLDLYLETHELLEQGVSVDGVLEAEIGSLDGYAELKNLAETIKASLVEQVVFSYVEPSFLVNLNNYFNTPPDASQIDYDPFVLEDDSIVPVEAFFEEILKDTVDFDLAQTYESTFVALKGSFLKSAFDEFFPFPAGGKILLED